MFVMTSIKVVVCQSIKVVFSTDMLDESATQFHYVCDVTFITFRIFFLAIVFPLNYLSVPSARGNISTARAPESQTTVSRLSGAKQAKYPQKASHAYD